MKREREIQFTYSLFKEVVEVRQKEHIQIYLQPIQ